MSARHLIVGAERIEWPCELRWNEPLARPVRGSGRGLCGLWLLWQHNGSVVRDMTGRTSPALVTAGGDLLRRRSQPGRRTLYATAGATLDRVNLGSIASSHPLALAGLTRYAIYWEGVHDGGSTFGRVIDKSSSGAAANGHATNTGNNTTTIQHLCAGDSGNFFESASGYLVNDGAVHRYLFVRAGDTGNFWRDGVLVSSETDGAVPAPSSATTNAALFTWNHTTTDRHWRGSLNAVAVWNFSVREEDARRLTLEGIETLLRPLFPGYPPELVPAAGGATVPLMAMHYKKLRAA